MLHCSRLERTSVTRRRVSSILELIAAYLSSNDIAPVAEVAAEVPLLSMIAPEGCRLSWGRGEAHSDEARKWMDDKSGGLDHVSVMSNLYSALLSGGL